MDLPESLEPYRGQIQLSTLSCVRFSIVEEDWPGRSHVGGDPDLPNTDAWPKNPEGKPMEFVLQIDLAEAAVPAFPNRGLLQFFYDVEVGVWGGEPGDEHHFRLLYHPDPDALASVASAADALPRRGIAFVPALSLPSVDEVELPADLEDEYEEIAWSSDTVHQLGGHAMPIQNPVLDYLPHLPDREGWRLLMQIDSEEEIGMVWGDAGRVYLMIRRDDLTKARFDRVQLNLQCY